MALLLTPAQLTWLMLGSLPMRRGLLRLNRTIPFHGRTFPVPIGRSLSKTIVVLAAPLAENSSRVVESAASVLSLESLEAYAKKVQVQKRKKFPFRGKEAAPEPAGSQPFKSKENSFSALGLSPLLQKRLEEEGLKIPTDVQVAAIPALLNGHDAAIQSFTGSGKTLAYLLPILTKVGPLKGVSDNGHITETAGRKIGVEAVVVAPSRELAMQIVREAEKLLGPDHRKAVQQLVGGANRERQEEALKKNKPSIVVGTPGRISEISRAGKLHTHHCLFLILDEADQLLSANFREDMRRILEHVGKRKTSVEVEEEVCVNGDSTLKITDGISPRTSSLGNTSPDMPKMSFSSTKNEHDRVERQTVLVSATMPTAVLRAASAWGQKPLLVRATNVVDIEAAPRLMPLSDAAEEEVHSVQESLPPSLEHFYAVCQLQHKVDTLRRCIHALDAKSVIVFMNHPQRLKDTVFKLEARGILAAALHGELSKLERTNTLAAFKNGKLRVLVISEIGARGLDVPNCDLVFNLELPTDTTHYAHRAGRTGRLGRKGKVVSVCEERESFVFKKFQRQLKISIAQCDFTGGKLSLCMD